MTEKVSTGSPFIGPSSPLRSAQFINDTIEVVSDYQQRKRLGGGMPPGVYQPRDSGKIKVKNVSGGDLLSGSVLQLGTYLLNSGNRFKDDESLWLEGDEPADPGAAERYAILKFPLKNGKIGEAFVSGCCIARIDVGDVAHKYATPVDGSTDLESATSGPIEILSELAGTGSQQAYVRLHAPGGSSYVPHSPVGLTLSSPQTIGSNVQIVEFNTPFPTGADINGPLAYADGTNFGIVLVDNSANIKYMAEWQVCLKLPASLGGTQFAQLTDDWKKIRVGSNLTIAAGAAQFVPFDARGSFWIPPSTFSVSTGAASAGTAHTHPVDIPITFDGFEPLEDQHVQMSGIATFDGSSVSALTINDFLQLHVTEAEDAVIVKAVLQVTPIVT